MIDTCLYSDSLLKKRKKNWNWDIMKSHITKLIVLIVS